MHHATANDIELSCHVQITLIRSSWILAWSSAAGEFTRYRILVTQSQRYHRGKENPGLTLNKRYLEWQRLHSEAAGARFSFFFPPSCVYVLPLFSPLTHTEPSTHLGVTSNFPHTTTTGDGGNVTEKATFTNIFVAISFSPATVSLFISPPISAFHPDLKAYTGGAGGGSGGEGDRLQLFR